MRGRKSKVIVAISGGVDSSVAAALLKRAGFYVTAIFMKFWSAPSNNGLHARWNRCCSPEAEKRARKVAQVLDIPFYVLNFEKEFKKKIVDSFLAEYKAGRTPNPCVVCNKEIKFGLLLKKTLGLGADFVATGHYARLVPPHGGGTRREIRNPKSEIRNINYKLLRARDKEKDQSYFLWQLNQNQLKHILFPVGGYTKEEVREMARKFNLPTADVKDSQEICFVRTTVEDFLQKYLKTKPGRILNKERQPIGRHEGIWFYTIGQRKGLKVSDWEPYYVLDKDIKKNVLVVTQEEKDLKRKELVARKVNWVSGKEPSLPLRPKVAIRYHTPLVPAQVVRQKIGKREQKQYKVLFSRSQRAITPGQSVVFYRGQELLGGGIIC